MNHNFRAGLFPPLAEGEVESERARLEVYTLITTSAGLKQAFTLKSIDGVPASEIIGDSPRQGFLLSLESGQHYFAGTCFFTGGYGMVAPTEVPFTVSKYLNSGLTFKLYFFCPRALPDAGVSCDLVR